MTVAAPVPDAAPTTVIQETVLVAVHPHPVEVVRVIVPEPPPATAVREVGVIEYVHVVPAWVTWNVWPATVAVPVREMVPAFALALSVTVPGPVPLAPLTTVIHAALLTAVQAQPAGAVTATAVDPAVASIDALNGDSVEVHDTPVWVRVTVCPATVIVPTRDVPVVFGATV